MAAGVNKRRMIQTTVFQELVKVSIDHVHGSKLKEVHNDFKF